MRLVNRILATLLALALLGGAVIALVEIVLAAFGRGPWLVPYPAWATWLSEQTFDAGVVRAVLIGLVVLGLVLLVLALRRGRPGSLPLPTTTEGVRVTASRRGLERTLTTAATRPEGISAGRVKASRRSARVKVTTNLREPGDLQGAVTSSVSDRLAELGLDGTVRPRVTLSRKAAR
ncbi:hypothetical protein DQ244_10185 [Blastococcus sp. TBT05-19]|uniref:DUF6286 domain-containing protein n=1 Tax=Blastococcus sp. TBT05-19 TaxID=2250581 RepID=UPI000DEACEB0|nr:DUF6286 domain-containing protein [Blastococcus sp. TBT05-19]RBY91665.1 hypothetical protein DQ244_10185 [Blastococcus sp. TBT05-19]